MEPSLEDNATSAVLQTGDTDANRLKLHQRKGYVKNNSVQVDSMIALTPAATLRGVLAGKQQNLNSMPMNAIQSTISSIKLASPFDSAQNQAFTTFWSRIINFLTDENLATKTRI